MRTDRMVNRLIRTSKLPDSGHAEAGNWIDRYLRVSPADVLFLVALIILLKAGSTRFFNDPGTGWHLVTGDSIINSGQVPVRDSFSFTRLDSPWVETQWLADVVMSLLVNIGGYALVALVVATVLAGLYRWVYQAQVTCGSPPPVALAITLCAAYAACGHFLARPLIATSVGVPLCFWWSTQYARGLIRLGKLWLLVPISAIWCNLHPGVLGGIVTVGICAVVLAAQAWLNRKRDTGAAIRRRAVTLALVTFGMGCATLANPYGLAWHKWVLSLMSMDMSQFVKEWMPPDLAATDTKAAIILVLVAVVGILLRRGRTTVAEALAILFWLAQAPGSYRHLPLLATILAIQLGRICGHRYLPLSTSIGASKGELVWLDIRRVSLTRSGRLSGAVVVILVLALVAQARPVSVLAGEAVGPSTTKYSIGALEYLRKYPPQGRLFNEVHYGGTLIRECPDVPVFIDDRFGLYGEQFITSYIAAVRQPARGAQQLLNEWGITDALLTPSAPLAEWLSGRDGWQKVYQDGVAVIFTRRSSISIEQATVR